MDRRQFLAGSAALAGAAAFGQASARADAPSTTALRATTRILDVNGKAAKVLGLLRADGGQGLTMESGQDFAVDLTNALDEPTLIHWHGLTPPWPLDGVVATPAPIMAPGETRAYRFAVAEGGTHWMHAHTLQEQSLLAAPLIVRGPAEVKAAAQEVVMLLHDFSFTPPEELLVRLRKGEMPGMAMGHGAAMGGMADMPGMKPGAMADMPGMGPLDVNDIDYDAYLANDRTLADPQVVRLDAGNSVRLRIINAASSTAFHVDLGALKGRLIAVDGKDVLPLEGSTFPIAMGQRLDIALAIPKSGGAFPVLALREGARERTGVVLATAGAKIGKIAPLSAQAAPLVTSGLEMRLSAAKSLPMRPTDRRYAVTLAGDMAKYSWALLGADALKVKAGERIQITIRNDTMMMHPMHLHGHAFQVVEMNGRSFQGARRDTLALPPMADATIAFDAVNPGRWAFHCHHLYHMASGMMAFVEYES